MFAYFYLAVTNRPIQTELALNTHITISDMRHDMSKMREKMGGQTESAEARLVPLIPEGLNT